MPRWPIGRWDHPTTRRLKHVENDRAVDLGFSGWVLGHIRHPKLVRLVADEVAVDQVRWRVHGFDQPSSVASASVQALEAGSAHQHRHGVVPHGDPITQLQFGMHPKQPIRAARLLADAGG